MEKEEGLTEKQKLCRLQSGDYTKDSKKRIVRIGSTILRQEVKKEKTNYILEQWFSCWRSQRYGMPTSRLGDHAFEQHNHFFYDEDDPEFVQKVQTNKKIYKIWLKLCRAHGIKPELFEWLFVGPARGQKEIQKVFGSLNKMNLYIERAIYWFREASACG